MKRYWILRVLKGLNFLVIGLAFFGWITMFLWNALLPHIFGLTIITFWQAIGLIILGRLIFGGFGHFGWGWERRHGWHHKGHLHNHLRQKWASMTPEEREKWKEKVKNRCRNGNWPEDFNPMQDSSKPENKNPGPNEEE